MLFERLPLWDAHFFDQTRASYMKESLDKLFSPDSIAVLGASASPGKAGHEMVRALLDFPGPVYPINPSATPVLGLDAFASITEVAQPIDLAIIALPARLCPQAVDEAIAAGVKAVMIISGGFAESGDDGVVLQQQILDACSANGVRLLGPNTSGFANPAIRLTANFAPGMDELSAGPVALISQSGAVTLTMSTMASDHGLGIRLAVGTGNGREVSPADVIQHHANDFETKVIAVYLDGVFNGRQLYDAIRAATVAKPVVVYTVGQGDIGEFAASHTGNLIGSYALKRAALMQAGAVLVDSVEELIDAAALFASIRLAANPDPGVCLITGQAGPGMIISDYLVSRGTSLPRLSEQTVDKVGELLPPMAFMQNPVDTGRPGPEFGKILELACDDPAVDVALAFLLHEPAAIDPVALLPPVKEQASTPLLFATAGKAGALNETVSALRARGVFSFRSPDRAARGVQLLVDDARRAWAKQQTRAPAPAATVDQITANPDEVQAKQIVRRIGIQTPDSVACDSHAQALQALNALAKPCAIKVLAAEIAHKTEVGGVQLGIDNEDKLDQALNQIDAIELSSPRRYLVEVMAPAGLDLILGAKQDASFGATLLVGLGGTQAEALNDVAMRLAPVTRVEAAAMLSELRGYALLTGWRGAPAVDTEAVIDAIVALSDLMQSHAEIKEVDINPLRALPAGVLALDALIVLQ